MTQLKRDWVIQCHLPGGCTGGLIRSASQPREDEEGGRHYSNPPIHTRPGQEVPFPAGRLINS